MDMRLPNNVSLRRHVNKTRLSLFCLFAFVFTATIAFLSTSNQNKTEAANASSFRAGNIMSDAVMTDYNSMTVAEIHNFLKAKNSCNQSADPAAVGALWYEDVNVTKHGINYNRRYYFNSSSGVVGGYYHVKDGHFVCMADETINGQSAAYLIWDAAQTFKINPKVLIVLLEKEQGLISDRWPYEVQYRAATGYGCPDTAACDSKYYGLEAQLGNAAYLFHTVLEGGWTNFPLGNNYIQYHPNSGCGGTRVNIENRATSALYRYTPYQPNAASLAAGYGMGDSCSSYGNRNFYFLYSDWFGDPHNGPNKVPAQVIPEGNYQISSKANQNLIFDIEGGVSNTTTSGKLIAFTKNSGYTPNQVFRFTYENGYYYITNPTSSLRIESSDSGAILTKPSSSCAQKWTISRDSDGYISIHAQCTNKALTLKTSAALSPIVLSDSSSSNSQKWYAKPLPADGITSGASYQVASMLNQSYALDISGGVNSNTKSGKAILFTRRVANIANQTFRFNYDEKTGYYYITNPTSNLRLDVENSSTANEAKVLLWSGHNNCNQKWLIERNSDGSYIFASACSGKALTIYYNKANDLQPIVIFDRNNQSNQKWKLVNPSSAVTDLDTTASYQIVPKANNNYTLDIYGGVTKSTTSGRATIFARRSSEIANQTFKFAKAGNYYQIVNPTSNLRLDVAESKTANDTNVLLWKGHDGCNQKWQVVKDAEGYYSFISACSGKALSIQNDKLQNSTQSVIYTDNTKETEKWKLIKL
ncbi:RICIN domain-containing protein [Candidatus Saccharibacteria bacterium]|nr:RICIN domain-containing protein [Candidatus Saccharibacteria bacterium]MBQ3467952.1 RICIN domain-containing protein [Candidatus Saccharibacteria bacterium]